MERASKLKPTRNHGAWLSLARALRSGRRGRRFKSFRPDLTGQRAIRRESRTAFSFPALDLRRSRYGSNLRDAIGISVAILPHLRASKGHAEFKSSCSVTRLVIASNEELSRRLIKNLEQVGIVLLPSENANDLNSVFIWAIDDYPFPWIGLRAAWEYANVLAKIGT